MRKRIKQTCVVLLLAATLFMSVQAQDTTDPMSAVQSALQTHSDIMDALDEYQRFLAMLVQLH
ncbi:hypothetical protein KAH43_04155, partial [Candidatus Bipolaricaulota bacterium]|nr:hypothetical protein [Candidatus Bipolaricaulota bacterium]